jgi:hypothetical protein
MRTLATFFWRWFVGALFTLTPLTAILVVGWTQRATARTVARHWHRRAGNATNTFADFAKKDAQTARLAHWPRWIMADDAGALLTEARRSGPFRGLKLAMRALFGSLWLNARAGMGALIPVAIVVAPAGLLLLLSWWGGWENSFNKGYEQAWVGPTVAFAGIIYFALAMTLLPLAEVRQAVNESWRTFFDIAFLRRAAREVRLGLIGLAALFATAGFVVAALKIAPLALGNTLQTPADVERVASQYPLIIAALLFPLYLALRLAAARTYARAAMKIAAKDGIEPFAPRERALLERLSLAGDGARRERSALTRVVVGSGSLAAGVFASAAMFAVWFAFVGEIYLSQFLAHDWTHWVNHPLVQLPWVSSVFR